MPIVFEEITGEIAPPGSSSAPPGGGDPAGSSGQDLFEQLQAQLAIQHERQARLMAD